MTTEITFLESIIESLELAEEGHLPFPLDSVQGFNEAGVLSNDTGAVVHLANGETFYITIQKKGE